MFVARPCMLLDEIEVQHIHCMADLPPWPGATRLIALCALACTCLSSCLSCSELVGCAAAPVSLR